MKNKTENKEKLPEKIVIKNNDGKFSAKQNDNAEAVRPDVSIVITAYNVSEYIRTAVLSALNF